MLHPDGRSLYTDALTPPPRHVFDQAIGTTYSLDPTTLLTIPVYLGLAARRKGADTDPVGLYGALRRVARRTTVYSQRGRMHAPRSEHVLFITARILDHAPGHRKSSKVAGSRNATEGPRRDGNGHRLGLCRNQTNCAGGLG